MASTPSTTCSRNPADDRASAIARTGIFTPVLECTQVMASSRVVGRIRASRRLTISSVLADAGSSCTRTRSTSADALPAARRSASWVE